MGKKDIVKITCYGRTEEMERHEAIKVYTEACYGSGGHERVRYETILAGLILGKQVVSDNIV